MPEAERLLTPEDIAERLGLALPTVRDKLRAGELPGFHLGDRFWRVREADLDEYIRQLAEDGAAERVARQRKAKAKPPRQRKASAPAAAEPPKPKPRAKKGADS